MNEPLKQQLQNTLQQFPSISLAIVFGSVAGGRESVQSDLDIGVRADRPIDVKLKMQLIEALAKTTGRPVDLIDLSTAGQPLLGEIIEHGTRVHGKDERYAELIMKNLLERADFLPYRNRILKHRRDAWLDK